MAIDFGDNPVAPAPTPTQTQQIKNILAVKSDDIVDATSVGKSVLTADSVSTIIDTLSVSSETHTHHLSSLDASGASNGQVIKFNGSQWSPATDNNSGVWGSITGDLTTQQDLSSALSTKQAILTSGVNIKTINSNNLLGNGNIDIGGFDPTDIGFFDDFSDTTRYKNGDEIVDGGTYPLVGSPWLWKPNETGAPEGVKPFIVNGTVQFKLSGAGYLAAHATPKDIRNFSYGFEYINELTYGTDTRTEFTITVGPAPLVTTTHNAWGRIHSTLNSWGVKGMPLTWGAYWPVTITPTPVNVISTGTYSAIGIPGIVVPSLESGDAVYFGGTLPAEITSGNTYYIIKISDGVYQIAATKANALSSTPIPISFISAGSGVQMSRTLECINREYVGSIYPWEEAPLQTRLLSASTATNQLSTNFAHSFEVGDAVRLGGTRLPGGLSANNVYYVATTPNRYSLTLSETKGGSPITLTSDGSPSQVIRGRASKDFANAQYSRGYMPFGKKNIIIITRRGDYLDWTLVGAGTITFYTRNLDEFLGAQGDTIGFYWQPPPPSPYPVFRALVSAWIDAPAIQEKKIQEYTSYIKELVAADRPTIPGRLELVPENGTAERTQIASYISTSIPSKDIALWIDGGPQVRVGSQYRRTGRHTITSGSIIFAYDSIDSAARTSYGLATVTYPNLLTTTYSHNFGDASYRNVGTCQRAIRPFMDFGDIEIITYTGQLSGVASREINLWRSGGSGPHFASGELSGYTGPFVLDVKRQMVATNQALSSYQEIFTSTFFCSNQIRGPQRYSSTYPGGVAGYALDLNLRSAVANTITIDSILHVYHKMTPN